MRAYRTHVNPDDEWQHPPVQPTRRTPRALLVALTFVIIGLAVALAPAANGDARSDGPAPMVHTLLAQDSPLESPLSVALNTEAAPARRATPAINDPDPGDQYNLMRVAAVIAGVLLVTVILWRQR